MRTISPGTHNNNQQGAHALMWTHPHKTQKCNTCPKRQEWITECIWSCQTNAMTRTPLNRHNTRLCHTGFNDNETNKRGWRYCLLWATIPCLLLERPAIQPVSVSLYSILYPALIADTEWWSGSFSDLYAAVYCPVRAAWTPGRGVRRGSRRWGGEVFHR